MDNLLKLLEYADYGMLILILLEVLRDYLVQDRSRSWGETFANLSIYVGNNLIGRTAIATVFVIALYAMQAFAVSNIANSIWTVLLALVLADFSYYWKHRVEHVSRFFWAYHSVHHSSPDYNLSTAYRLPWLSSLVEWLFFVPMVLVGFDPLTVAVCYNLVLIYQFWIHTQKIQSLGPLEWLFNTPSHHRVHHASNANYIDKNFGGILIIWDRLFGSFAAEGETVRFGLTKPIASTNPFVINFQEYGVILRDLWRSQSIGQMWRVVFGHPAKQESNI